MGAIRVRVAPVVERNRNRIRCVQKWTNLLSPMLLACIKFLLWIAQVSVYLHLYVSTWKFPLFNVFIIITCHIATSTVSQSVFETQNEGYNPTDLTKFQTQFGLALDLPSGTSSQHATTSCLKNGNDLCSEGNLDLMYLMGVAPNADTLFFYIDETSTAVDPFLTYLLALSNMASPPLVNSISWGGVEQVWVTVQYSLLFLLLFMCMYLIFVYSTLHHYKYFHLS